MSQEELLLSAIIERFAAGILTRDGCQATWWGYGRGHPCVACGRPITAAEIECECDLPDGDTIRFHRLCFEVWNRARLPP